MCGIAGYFGPKRIDDERIAECLRRMHHRGPDAHGVYSHVSDSGRCVYLLHSRLSIIDLDDRANQPFRVGSQVLTYNGELYNYIELASKHHLREQLRTRSDTEVLLHVIGAGGLDALDACEGMWAFGLYDERDDSLTLCRDRFGEKPLYYLETRDGIYFGSEVKFIAALIAQPLRVNVEHLLRYMVHGYRSLYRNCAGFFQDVREVKAGTALHIDQHGRAAVRRYWNPVFTHEEASHADVVARTRAAIMRAIELRLRADVPVAFLISGGVDSNSLAAVAMRELGFEVHGFTILNRDRRYDEYPLIEHSVRELGIRHTAVELDRSHFLDRLRSLVQQHDAPVATITYYAQWLLMCEIAAQGFRISISGTGADELFGGYYDHHLAYLYEIQDDPLLYASSLGAWRKYIRPIVRNPYLSDADLFIRDSEFREHLYLDAPTFASCLRRPWNEAWAEERFVPGLLRNRMLNELFRETVPPILHADDHNAMSHSIENRSPFLDRGLFEAAQSIPTPQLFQDGFGKAVLRSAMRGIAPARILDERRKVGFNAPIADLLDVSDPEQRAAVLRDSPIFEHVRRESIGALLDVEQLPNSRSKFLFYFLNAKCFLEEFAS